MSELERVELGVRGMDCAGCVATVKGALETVPGVRRADVLLAAEKAIIEVERGAVDAQLL